MNYIISGPGRTGGHLMINIIKSTGTDSVHYTHDPELYLNNDAETTLIVLDRRDRFAAVMSNAIVHHTGQSVWYENKNIQPFELSPGVFRWAYVQYIDYYRKHDLARPYAAVYKIYFEDFVNNHNYIKKILNLPNLPVAPDSKIYKLLNSPAPYNYKDIVVNWEKLQRLYNQLADNQQYARNHGSQHS